MGATCCSEQFIFISLFNPHNSKRYYFCCFTEDEIKTQRGQTLRGEAWIVKSDSNSSIPA